MTSAKEQGELWGARVLDWARCGEPAWRDVFIAVLDQAQVSKGTRHLDIGCGAGAALLLSRERGAHVSGCDASENMASFARERLPGAKILVGDMEDLPFVDETFDVTTGINAFQFARDQRKAFAEAARVTRQGGSVTMLVWGPREKCEIMSEIMPHITALLPPEPPVPTLPLAARAEDLMREAGLEPGVKGDIIATLTYADHVSAVNAIMAASERAIRHTSEATVRKTLEDALKPFVGAKGTVKLRNQFRLVTAKRPAAA